MAWGPEKRRAFITTRLAVMVSVALLALLLGAVFLGKHRAPLWTSGAWSELVPRTSCGVLTITAPSREPVHTTVNHGLGQVPVAVILGLDLPGFDYYEFIDDQREPAGSPQDRPVHLSAMVRKPYNGTFTIRLKHSLGSQRAFTVRWLAINLQSAISGPSFQRGDPR